MTVEEFFTWCDSQEGRWVQVWQRRDDGRWLVEDVIVTGELRSAALVAEVGLAELDAGVEVE